MTTIRMIETAPADPAYRAGACNIGPAEIRRRRDFGIAAAVIAVALGIVLLAIGASVWARLLLFFPATGAAIGLLQARFRFCVAFAIRGVRDFGPLGSPESVVDAADHRADLVAAAKLVGLGVVVGGAVTVVFLLLPV